MSRRSTDQEIRILSRRSKVAPLVLKGVTNQFEICAQLGMDRSQQRMISRDLAAIRADWRQSAIRDFDEAKGRELEKLDVLEKEYWDAWERSRNEHQSSRSRKGMRAGDEFSEASMTKEARDGNPAFLAGVLACIEKRCALLGLDAPTRIKHGGDEQSPPIKHDLTIDQFRQLPLDEKLRVFRQTLGDASRN